MRKLAVLFPGIGYTMDRPLLHFSRRLAAGLGYEIRPLPYSGFPSGVRGDREKLLLCCETARTQAEKMLSDMEMSSYDDILFIGKSIGTVAAADIAARSPVAERIRQVIYTPLENTFSASIRDAVVFTGGDDPWTGGRDSRIPALCAAQKIPCHVIPGANHSLETGCVESDLANLRRILQIGAWYFRRMSIREAGRTDFPAVGTLHVFNQRTTYRGLLSDDYLDGLDPTDRARKWETFAEQEGQKLFVAEDETGLLGFAACRADPEDASRLYLDSLHTSPRARGQGVGTALMRHVGRYARERGYRAMSVCIVRGNERARSLYTKMGAVHEKDFMDSFEGTISVSEKLRWPDLGFADHGAF